MKKGIALLLTLLMLLGAVSASASFNEEGYPIVNEPITLKAFLELQ